MHNEQTVVQGQLVDAGGTPVPGAALDLRGWNGQVLGQSYTSGSGSFEFDTSFPGPYQLVVHGTDRDVVVPVDFNHPGNVQVRMPAAVQPATQPATGNAVSVNDLAVPAKARDKLNAAVKALGKRDYAKAAQLSNEALAIAPTWGRAYFMRALLEMQLNDYTAAGADLRQADAVQPDDQATLVALGRYYTETGDYAAAKTSLTRALAAPLPSWQAHYEKANLDLQVANFGEAEEMARAALDDTPPADSSAYFLLAQAEYYQGKRAAAARDYTTYLQAAVPGSPNYAAASAEARARLAQIGRP